MTGEGTNETARLLGWGPDKRVLAFNLALIKRVVVKKTCDEQQALLTIVPPALSETPLIEIVLRAMAGEKFENKDPGEAFTGEMLVFCGFQNDDLDAFISAYKASGIPRIELKAVLTHFNADWTPKKLFEELSKEHDAFDKH